MVSDKTFVPGLGSGFARILKQDGIIKGFFFWIYYPILFKQVPYTMAKFAVQEQSAEMIYTAIGKPKSQLSNGANTGVYLASGLIAGTAAAIISQPADTLLSKVNKAGAGGEGLIRFILSTHML